MRGESGTGEVLILGNAFGERGIGELFCEIWRSESGKLRARAARVAGAASHVNLITSTIREMNILYMVLMNCEYGWSHFISKLSSACPKS